MAGLSLNVPAVEKLVDYTASGLGAIAGPMLAPWRASREGKARLVSARADAEVRRIEVESGAQSLVIIAEAQAEARQTVDATMESERGMMEITRDDISQSIEFQARKRLANSRSAVESAAAELGDKEVSDHTPDPDWTAASSTVFRTCHLRICRSFGQESLQARWRALVALHSALWTFSRT